MSRVCTLCCVPVKRTSVVQCKKCKGVLHCFYCSPKCRKADAARHKDECYAGVEIDDQPQELKDFANFKGPDSWPDTATVYRCGTADGAAGFEVRRELPNPSKKRAARS